MHIDYSIGPTVDLGQAYRGLMRARGHIVGSLRQEIMHVAERNVWRADGHKAVKRARDVRRQVRKLEMKRRGWK